MGFIHTWAIIAGLAAVGLPIAIHFLTRPKPISLPLSTIRFVRHAVRQKRARYRLRDIVILALRTLAIATLALAFARPLFNGSPVAKLDESASSNRVVILDVSQSMSAIEDGVVAMDRARVSASRYLHGYNTRANLILAGAQPRSIFNTPSRNLNALKDALAEVEPKPERVDVNAAIELAARMLATSSQEAKTELVIVSDFQRTNWASAKFDTIPEKCLIQLESVAPRSDADNVGIVDVRFADRATAGGTSLLEIVVANSSSAPQKVQCSIEMNDTAFTIDQICPARVKTTIAQQVEIRNAGWQIGSASFNNNDDALREDDKFPFALKTELNSEFKLVTRTRSSSGLTSSLFVERALNPFEAERAAGQPVISRMMPGRLDSQSVGNSQLLIFDHPGKLESKQIELMASLLRRGRSILYFASELLDANNLKMLYDAVGSDLQAPVELLPPDNNSVRRDLQIATVQKSRRPFQVFGETVTASLAGLRFSGGLDTRQIPGGIEEEVLARLSDQSALAFVSRVGAGNLCVFNADLNRSNFPNHPSFVPILNELTELLLETGGRRQTAFCGEPLTRLLPTSIAGVDDLVVEPAAMRGTFRRSGEGVVWLVPEPGGPGVAMVSQDENLAYAVSTNIPPVESDLRCLDGEILTKRLAGARNVSFHGALDQRTANDAGWIWCAVAVVISMITEVVFLNLFKT